MSDIERRIERCLAIAELLAQPDPPEIRRGHRLKVAGKPNRYELVPVLAATFVQTKLLALHERRAESALVNQASLADSPIQAPLRIVARISAAA
jgi:hypothetical protein